MFHVGHFTGMSDLSLKVDHRSVKPVRLGHPFPLQWPPEQWVEHITDKTLGGHRCIVSGPRTITSRLSQNDWEPGQSKWGHGKLAPFH